jgi:hypothetical protein
VKVWTFCLDLEAVMVALQPGKPLLLYVMTTVEVVSMVLVVEQPEL